MPAGSYNITIEPGASFLLPISLTAASVPVDLTGYTINVYISKAPGMDPSLVLSTSNGGILATPLLGTFSIYATAAQTHELADISVSPQGVWLLQTVSSTATPFVTNWLTGKVIKWM